MSKLVAMPSPRGTNRDAGPYVKSANSSGRFIATCGYRIDSNR